LSRLPVLSGDEILSALRRGGFLWRSQVGSHVAMKHPETGLKVSVPVHAGRDVTRGTLRRIIRDAGLTVEEFRGLLK
jgi:predicted RNA binding protein YcfA (HicA-like mRNA interferase family)